MCVVYGLYYVEVVFLYAHSLESFHHTQVLNFVKSFSASVEMIVWFLSFNLTVWPITLIDLDRLKSPCIPWAQSFLIMAYDPFNVCLDSVC